MQENMQARNVTLQPLQWATVEALAKAMGLSVSAALRVIISEWARMKAQQRPWQLVDTQPPYITEER